MLMRYRLRIAALACGLVTLVALVGLVAASGALAAFPGTNGKIAFGHDEGTAGSSFDIFSMDPNGQNRMQLTSGPEDDAEPSWSANGEKILFRRDPAPSSNRQIWVMNFDGTGQSQITNNPAFDDTDPYFFPNGQKIAFQRDIAGDDQIFVMNADGSNPVQLTFTNPAGDESFEPSVSPNGQMIVFRRHDGATGFNEIWVMNADGSSQTRLTTGSATVEDFNPDWSPNGQRIAFHRFFPGTGNNDIFIMNADGSGQTPVTNEPAQHDRAPVFAPDDTLVAFERENDAHTFGNIFVASPNGLNQSLTNLTNNSAPVFDFGPGWQPLNPPDCALTGKATSKSFSQVTLTVTCTNDNVTGVFSGTGAAPKVPKAAVISKKKKFQIPALNAQVPEGTPTSVTLKVSKKGKKLLKKASKAGKKGKATITATLTDDLGLSSTETFSVKFKAKKK